MSGKVCLQALFVMLYTMVAAVVYAEEITLPTGSFDNAACIECHEKIKSALVSDWRASSHARAAPQVNCISCHGRLHETTAATARHDSACIECHGGSESPVVHSYSTSKHGVLMRLERNKYNWQQSLSHPCQEAGYTFPRMLCST